MKINAILGRGKKKDLWDLCELLHYYLLEQMIAFHKQKFPNQLLLISIPLAITYFTDAEETEEPVSLKGQTWSKVKKFIGKKQENIYVVNAFYPFPLNTPATMFY